MPRLLIVSNRLPVTLRVEEGGEIAVSASVGGVATALRGPHERRDGLWIGWTGDTAPLSPEQEKAVDARLAELGAVPVHLPATEAAGYYEGFSNGILWPLFHYLLDKVDPDGRRAFEAYEAVNERFAEVVARESRPGDAVWVNDYQLMLLPELLRRRRLGVKIGFFLHIPFPSPEVFRTLPWRERLLRGLLGADVIGFHTAAYRHHFARAAARLLGAETDGDTVSHAGRSVRLGVHPIGVDAGELDRLARTPEVQAEARRIREQAAGEHFVLGVDRLDYTKGLPLRLAAIECFLEREPELCRGVRFLQLAVPTRENVEAYQQIRKEVNELVGRINSRHGSVGDVPIHFLYRSMPMEEVAVLYAAADVMLVTPLRDGMNLVAKEYVSTRVDGSGALVLSEFTGAAAELSEALIVNPYDIDAVASGLKRALTMSREEQRIRMEALRRRVLDHDVHGWAQAFLDDLEHAAMSAASSGPDAGPPPPEVMARARRAPKLLVLLDYDGTLVPIAPRPELASPDPELLELLTALANRPGTRVHVVSGRGREDLDRWLGALPIHLHAEHGAAARSPGMPWVTIPLPPPTWIPEARAVLDEATRATPGSLVEQKATSLAWHYRNVDPELAGPRLQALEAALAPLLRTRGIETMDGAKVLEVRPAGLHKGLAAARAIELAGPDAVVIAAGDDRTDEDLFAALPGGAITLHVGPGPSRARYRAADPDELRRLLRSLLG